MTTDIEIIKPEPFAAEGEIETFKRGIDVARTIEALEAGNPILVTELYSNGLSLLRALHSHLGRKLPNKSFQEIRAYRAEYHKMSNLILIKIVDQKLAVKKAPAIGWLEKLYPEISEFLLPFPQVQGLNSSWQWYLNGLSVPVLENKIHPYYGTYFPTRFEHLQLFDNWLKRYEGPKKSAIEVGIGCGVLSLQMVQNGFHKVFASDTNPNAIVGLAEFMGDTELSGKIELDFGHIFGKWDKPAELIVFNPPWLPKSHDLDKIDEAIYYDENLFPDFFTGAKQRLLPEGKMILIFSNLAQITNMAKEHPIKQELEDGGRFQLEQYVTKPVKASSKKTKRVQPWRSSQEVELWVLVHK
ncbi:MAG: methyltransferase [Candidatus Latescibacteria bacterium]|nr:methyltransferase [Candidatus Latescibacterota bacterium]